MKTNERGQAQRGFTLVEIMIVVAIISLVTAIALPSFAKARNQSMVNTMANDIRVVFDAFNMYAMENGSFPADVPGEWVEGEDTPVAVAEYLDGAKWEQGPILGGTGSITGGPHATRTSW
ncbi:MAG: type II secretion system protein [Verrucomicrobia bacterium]|nr:type II secretion system protein [Verrucomicrobiota bacterium]